MAGELDRFTPIIPELAREIGLMPAAVYGVIWRYCQMKEGICKASLQTIGRDIGIDRVTAMRGINKLCKLGYVIDTTPNKNNASHIYILGKTVSNCNTNDPRTVSNRNSDSVQTVSNRNNLDPTVSNRNATVSVCNTNIDSKKEDINAASSGKKMAPPEQNKIFLSLARLCQIDLRVATDRQIGQLDQSARVLAKRILDTTLFEEKFEIYWTTIDWRGKQGQRPTPPQIREVYGNYSSWLESDNKNGHRAKVSISAK